EPEETWTLLPKFSPRPQKKRRQPPEEDQDVAFLNEINKETKVTESKQGKTKKKEEEKEEEIVTKSNNRINFVEDVLRKSRDQESSLSDLENIERDDLSDEFHSSDGEDDIRDDCTSWDDTICSNRSAYFKMYYQRFLTS
ncbi:hypothetical protein SK128_019767, partial [Halocaridina rubra]